MAGVSLPRRPVERVLTADDGRGHVGTMPASAERKGLLVASIPTRTRKTIQAAAELQGSSLNLFVTEAACQKALELLEQASSIRLNADQTRRVFGLLDTPPKPNRALLSAKAIHERMIRAEN